MSVFESFWKLLTKYVLSPKAESAHVEELVRRAKSKLPPPVIWLLGKTQAGKTSIIRALTGSTQAEIGNGFRPCTRTARLYSFPSEDDCLLRFLDTRGLGESNYDPADDIVYCQEQAHILMVVARAMDHAQNRVHDALSMIRRAKPNWPVIVA
ncbi:MAG: GTPase domain-containing protein, partial [Planctomycetia bacterium]|nr:GTPase domain-containing protein [Planctomycetia bacterium]